LRTSVTTIQSIFRLSLHAGERDVLSQFLSPCRLSKNTRHSSCICHLPCPAHTCNMLSPHVDSLWNIARWGVPLPLAATIEITNICTFNPTPLHMSSNVTVARSVYAISASTSPAPHTHCLYWDMKVFQARAFSTFPPPCMTVHRCFNHSS